MSHGASALIARTAAEQEMLDLLIRAGTHGVSERDLNPRKGVRRARALDEWEDAGSVVRVNLSSFSRRLTLSPGAVSASDTISCHARAIAPHWRVIDEAEERIAESLAAQGALARALPDIIISSATRAEMMDRINGLSGGVSHNKDVIGEINHAVWLINRERDRVDERGIAWSEVLDEARALVRQQRASERALRSAEEAIDPDADPLGDAS